MSHLEPQLPEHVAGAIDQSGALMVVEVLLKVLTALPQGRDLLIQAMETKTREVSDLAGLGCADVRTPAALALMRQMIEDACAA
jgi:hypothetical protein